LDTHATTMSFLAALLLRNNAHKAGNRDVATRPLSLVAHRKVILASRGQSEIGPSTRKAMNVRLCYAAREIRSPARAYMSRQLFMGNGCGEVYAGAAHAGVQAGPCTTGSSQGAAARPALSDAPFDFLVHTKSENFTRV